MSNVKGPDKAQNPDFEELVAQYQGSVLRMCFLYLCDKTLAEDAVQETFVKVYLPVRQDTGGGCCAGNVCEGIQGIE